MQDYGKQEVQRMLKLLLFAVLTLVNIPSFVSAQFFEQGQFVKDIENRVLWLRCSVGQVWEIDKKTCSGSILKLNQSEILEAIRQANDQLPGNWRLPSVRELESLVCATCAPAKVQEKYFPQIAREAYWSGTPNTFNKNMYWTVNFQTGHTYSRFLGYQQLPFLLVQDY